MPTIFRSRLPLAVTFATLPLAACSDLASDEAGSDDQAVESENGFSANGFSANGFSANGFSANGFPINGFTINGFTSNGFSLNGFTIDGIETTAGLSSTTGLMTTAGGREVIKYMVKVAYPAGASVTKRDQYGNSYTFEGALGVAPEMQYGSCDLACQERVSAAMLAHVNNSGLHVGIWLVGPDNGIGWGSSPNYPYQEGAYFGNLFAPNPKGNYCAGKDLASGAAKGRLGSAFGTSNNILNCPYGTQWDSVSNQNVPLYCANGSNNYCMASGEGFSSCQDNVPQTPYASGHAWTHTVTVYRNFEPTQLYKICNRSGKCLGVVGGSTTNGANVEQRAFTTAAGQTWQVLQVSPGNYKIINKTSGMSLDLNGTQAVQRPYAGTPSQIMPMAYIAGDPGRANLRMSSMALTAQLMPSNILGNDGVLIQVVAGYPTGAGSPDAGRWAFIPVGLATLDPSRTVRLVPQHALTKSVEVPYASTANGTSLQLYDTWNGDPQKFFIRDANNGNVKLTMKVNQNKCIGPRNNGTTAGTLLEVQDCNGSYNQAWITAEDSSHPGTFIFRNAQASTLCLEVLGGNANNGALLDLFTCNTTASNQKFAMQAAP